MTMLNYLDPNPKGQPAVLLLHGLGANGSSWALQIPPLIEAGFRPLAPDAPGFGDSPYDGKGWSIKRAAAAMAELLLELQTGPAHVVGLSMGGAIAQQFAIDHPQLTGKLILVSTFAALRPVRWTGWFYYLQRFILVHTLGIPAQAKFVARRIFPAEKDESLREMLVQQITRADPRAYRGAMRSLGLFNSRNKLVRIKAATLVITGVNDTTVSYENQRLLAEGIRGARLVIIPGAGHAVSVDQPESFNKTLMEFLAAVR
jgi:3-oxoadipate enol-lactonase